MGNHSSSSASSATDSRQQKLLRRNKRTAFHSSGQPGALPFGLSAGEGVLRPGRSRSLEPQSGEAVRVIEHSQSAKYPRSRRVRLTLTPDVSSPGVENSTGEISLCITGLTHNQKVVLQKVWMVASPRELIHCSRNMMAQLLRTQPLLIDLFRLPHVPEAELLLLTDFCRLSANFAMTFDFVMANLVNDLTKVCVGLESLGGHHASLGFALEPAQWTLFQHVFEENPPQAVHTHTDGHPVWRLMVAFVVRQMRVGYNKAIAQRTTQKDDTDNDHS